MKIKFNTFVLLIIVALLSLIFTYIVCSALKLQTSPFIVRGIFIKVDPGVIPNNFSPSKSSNPEFFMYIFSKLNLPDVSFDKLFVDHHLALRDCSDFKSTQYIKNPFTSNRVVFNFSSDFSSITIQAKHNSPIISENCILILSDLINSYYQNNIKFSLESLKRLNAIKENSRLILNNEAKKNGFTNNELSYLLSLSPEELSFIFSNKEEYYKFFAGKSPGELKIKIDAVRTFNLLYDESKHIIDHINNIKLVTTYYTVKSANYSVYRIVQIYISFFFLLLFIFFFLMKFNRKKKLTS